MCRLLKTSKQRFEGRSMLSKLGTLQSPGVFLLVKFYSHKNLFCLNPYEMKLTKRPNQPIAMLLPVVLQKQFHLQLHRP